MEIKSVSDFMARCSANPLLKQDGVTVFYRGVNRIYPLAARHIPSLYYPPNEFYKYEDGIFREVVSLFPDEMLAQRLTVEKLFIMQHYRFPTRLLDISKNPLTDLFFACFADRGQEAALREDGAVYVYAVPTKEIKFADSDAVSILANLCKRPHPFSIRDILRQNRDDFNDDERIQYLVYDIQEEKPHFLNLVLPETMGSVICIRPRMNNPRVIRQDGYFFLFGIDGDKARCAQMKADWIKDLIVIPAKYKKPILEELDKMDYNEGFFYPDFEHASNTVRRRYGKK
ncbi:MAG: FRG domain-containing protein [Spirochaetaceae bacterium]|jgi:hypothetical protein|nr:FRG domain-containing protein [Spirochaetaceae bacterium]